MLSILGGLNLITERTLIRCMTSARESRIIGHVPGAERFAGIRQICGRRRFMRSIISQARRSILECDQPFLDRRKAAL
jgi:hypothetical protein